MSSNSNSDGSSPVLEAKERPQLQPEGLGRSDQDEVGDGHGDGAEVARKETLREKRHRWKRRVKEEGSEGEANWWFASTGIPLLAATIGPLANVLSLAALVTYWRMDLIAADGTRVPELSGTPFPDPHWCYWLNVASLILGFVGNIFLLFNFTNRIRYIIALPMTIVLWYVATAILIAITVSMQVHVPPQRPNQTYTQGFWYGVIAAILYLISSMLLMVNMLGYFLGHYPQHFNLTDHQRTLILQTMLFFIWLAGGGAVFSKLEQDHVHTEADRQAWAFVDGLYFCDVTILTVGFGDLYPVDDVGRGLVFPYSVGGIIMLGLVISSLHNFVRELGQDKVIKRHVEKQMHRTLSRTVRSSTELASRERDLAPGVVPNISGPFNPRKRSKAGDLSEKHIHIEDNKKNKTKRQTTLYKRNKKPKLILLREEKDRFDKMRSIQHETDKYKRWYRLTISVIAFSLLWCIGAVVFWQCEKDTLGMTYFQALYFCYVSLLTIGYGDMAPKSNSGRCFFVVWSLIAVPTMTILVSDMGDTVISAFNRGTFALGDWTFLPKAGIYQSWLRNHPWLLNWIQERNARRAAKKRLKVGFTIEDPDEDPPTDLPGLAAEVETDNQRPPSSAELAKRLARAIRRTADDMKLDHPKKYSYEEWVEFTRLIRFTTRNPEEVEEEEEDEGLVHWDWIGPDSPMCSGMTESEFVLDRLCESLARYMRKVAPTVEAGERDFAKAEEEEGKDNARKEDEVTRKEKEVANEKEDEKG